MSLCLVVCSLGVIFQRPGGGTGERQAGNAVDAMRAFLWSSFLPADDVPIHTPGSPASLPRETIETGKSAAGDARIGELTVSATN